MVEEPWCRWKWSGRKQRNRLELTVSFLSFFRSLISTPLRPPSLHTSFSSSPRAPSLSQPTPFEKPLLRALGELHPPPNTHLLLPSLPSLPSLLPRIHHVHDHQTQSRSYRPSTSRCSLPRIQKRVFRRGGEAEGEGEDRWRDILASRADDFRELSIPPRTFSDALFFAELTRALVGWIYRLILYWVSSRTSSARRRRMCCELARSLLSLPLLLALLP